MRIKRIFTMILATVMLVQNLGTSAYAAGVTGVLTDSVKETVIEDEVVASEEESEEQTTIT